MYQHHNEPQLYHIAVDKMGRMVIPVELRRDFGIENTIVMERDAEGLHIKPLEQRARKAQELVRQFVPKEISLVDELIRQRRAEAAKERSEMKKKHD